MRDARRHHRTSCPPTFNFAGRARFQPPGRHFPMKFGLGYDASYEPVVLGHTMFVPSMVNDSVTALDTETGQERWRFITEGPVRFAPVAWEGKVYVVSDDGYLYCLNAENGSCAGSSAVFLPRGRDRKVLGHGRLVSLFPARGGPVVGRRTWSTSPRDSGPPRACSCTHWTPSRAKPSGRIPTATASRRATGTTASEQYAGLTPQGYLAIVGDRLVVPCGTQLPAFLDLKTGKLQTYTMGWGGRVGLPKGCWFVAGVGNYLSHAGDLYDITRPNDERFADTKPASTDFKPMLYPGGFTRLDIERANQRELDSFRQPVFTPEAMYESDDGIVARDLTAYRTSRTKPRPTSRNIARTRFPTTWAGFSPAVASSVETRRPHQGRKSPLCRRTRSRGSHRDAGQEPKVVWHAEFDGTPQRMLAADDKLFIVTTEGSILAFAAPQPGEAATHVVSDSPPPAADEWTAAATTSWKPPARNGYALVLGIERGRLAEELARQSDLQVIAVDEDAGKVTALRERLYGTGLYGTRVAVLEGDPVTYPFPPYLASLVVSETPEALEQAGNMHWPRRCTTPCDLMAGSPAPGVRWQTAAGSKRSSRTNHLPVPAYARRAISSCWLAQDRCRERPIGRTRKPMPPARGFGRRVHSLPHGHPVVRCVAAVAQISRAGPGTRGGGRVVLLEEGLLRASDVYTGRKLWEVEVSSARSRSLNRWHASVSATRDTENGVPAPACRRRLNWWLSRTRSI